MEILSPAGNLDKIKYAIAFGADAVYAGSQDFSLRAKADTFSHDDLLQAVEYCHIYDKKLFVPLNIYAHNRHIEGIKLYIKRLADADVDAVIVSDLGVFDMVKNIAPEMPIHVSTQANVTSYESVKAYERLGAKRIILARELTFAEILEIRERCPEIELEMFVHGAMCIAYSGRCLLSAYLNNRSANLGECTQPCRWKYTLQDNNKGKVFDKYDYPIISPDTAYNYALIEDSRPDETFPIEEDAHGFYFMNSKDLCLWNRLEQIHKAGIDSVKIEGRMKSLYYVAAVTRAYKQTYLAIEKGLKPDIYWKEELDKISHRIYTEGFFNGFNESDSQNYETSSYIRDWQFVGNIINYKNGFALVKSYHKITADSEIEIIFPDPRYDRKIKGLELYDEDMERIEFTKPNSCFYLRVDGDVQEFGVLRYKV